MARCPLLETHNTRKHRVDIITSHHQCYNTVLTGWRLVIIIHHIIAISTDLFKHYERSCYFIMVGVDVDVGWGGTSFS